MQGGQSREEEKLCHRSNRNLPESAPCQQTLADLLPQETNREAPNRSGSLDNSLAKITPDWPQLPDTIADRQAPKGRIKRAFPTQPETSLTGYIRPEYCPAASIAYDVKVFADA